MSQETRGYQLSRRLKGALEGFVDARIDPEVLKWVDTLVQAQDEFGFDPYGFQPEYLRYVLPFAQWLIQRYFRVEVFGIEHIPDKRVLLIANHSGQIPIDGMVVVSSCILHRTPPRIMRAMIEKWVPSVPFASYVFARCGQVIGTPENCERLLNREEGILVFPEGVRGISKPFQKRYQLQDFGLGFMRLALRLSTPIVPVAVIGAEEQAPSFVNAKRVAKMLGMPSFPVTPTFPWLGPLGLLPYPVRYRLHFGEPMHFDGDPDDIDQVIAEKVAEVRNRVQTLVDHGLETRESVFW